LPGGSADAFAAECTALIEGQIGMAEAAEGLCGLGENQVIRQAISCDICGTEKKQTNHWFVAYDQSGELRVSGWNSRNRLRPGSKHLCGQTCLHKLVDEFMAKALAVRLHPTTAEEAAVETCVANADASLASDAAYPDFESSARLIPTPAEPALPKAPLPRPAAALVALPIRVEAEPPARAAEETPRFASRNWRAEAWDRERERTLRTVDRRPGILARRRSGS